MDLKLLKDADIKNKTVLYRSPYDIGVKEMSGELVVKDDSRIRATLPTLQYLLERNCKIIILTWVKRPEGVVDEKLRTIPHAKKLQELLNHAVTHVSECVGPEVDLAVSKMHPQDILMLENTRFHKEEFTDDDDFAKRLTKNSDIIVFDGFPQAHRVHASTTGILRHLPSCAGFYFENEIKNLSSITESPKRPFTIVIGGAKVTDKISAIQNMVEKADNILVGGAVANVFLKSSGFDIASSFVEDVFVDQSKRSDLNLIKIAEALLEAYREKLILPTDFVISDSISEPIEKSLAVYSSKRIPKGWAILDIGPKSQGIFANYIKTSKTVFWNGPMGLFEDERFSDGTKVVTSAICKMPEKSINIISGGDTIEALNKYGHLENITYVSLAGGAAFELLAGKRLQVIEMLKS